MNKNIYDWYGIRPTQLDTIADPMFYIDLWGQLDSPNAQAYNYLFDLDLTGEEKGPGLHEWTENSGWERSIVGIIWEFFLMIR